MWSPVRALYKASKISGGLNAIDATVFLFQLSTFYFLLSTLNILPSTFYLLALYFQLGLHFSFGSRQTPPHLILLSLLFPSILSRPESTILKLHNELDFSAIQSYQGRAPNSRRERLERVSVPRYTRQSIIPSH
jgi:hypothetical protein